MIGAMKAFAAVLILAVPALAGGAGQAAAHCQCVGNGTKYEQGELACLRLPNGPILARCDKVYNNSSWTKVGDGCPQARAGDDAQTRRNDVRKPSFSLFDLSRG